MNNEQIFERAVLAGLRISAWTARKYDRKASQEVAEAHGATIDAGRYNKHLMPADAATYKALTQHISAMRSMHLEQTLPWSDDGWRLLPITNYDKYKDLVRKGQNKFHALLDDFAVDYPDLCREAQRRYNGLYNSEDYPAKVRDRYSFEMEINPVPSGTDFRVKLSAKEIAILSANAEARAAQAFETAQNDAVKRLYECVGKIHERLTATTKDEDGEIKPGVFRDSLIGNARDLCDVLKRLNLADDPRLETLRQQTEVLARVEPQTLRENADTRKETAKRADEILAAMGAAFGRQVIA